MIKTKRTQPSTHEVQANETSMRQAFPDQSGNDPLRHLTLQVPESVRRELKTVASQQGTTVREIVQTAIRKELDLRQLP